jgi:hypothetical protein
MTKTVKELNERQRQAVEFLERDIARCYQEKISLIDMLYYLLNMLSPQLEHEGLKLFIGTTADSLYRDGLMLEARRLFEETKEKVEEEIQA